VAGFDRAAPLSGPSELTDSEAVTPSAVVLTTWTGNTTRSPE
jgi:hypothetical protein